MNTSKEVTITYKNWRGDTSTRKIIPIKIWFGATEWHKEIQWFLKAIDVDKQAERDFAIKDIQNWEYHPIADERIS